MLPRKVTLNWPQGPPADLYWEKLILLSPSLFIFMLQQEQLQR